PGNVNITAGRDVFGHFVLADGRGSINAGRNIGVPLINSDGSAGDPTRGFALSLINGGWDVKAAGSIYVQDVRNPNGIFGEKGTQNQNNRYIGFHVFNYDPDASVQFRAGDSVEITGLAAPHLPPSGVDTQYPTIPLIFPPTFKVTAGSGGF